MVERARRILRKLPHRPIIHVSIGVMLVLGFLYAHALWNLTQTSGGMDNKFTALAKNEYFGFLVWENVRMLAAYGVLWVIGTLWIYPSVIVFTRFFKMQSRMAIILHAVLLGIFWHAFFTLRLSETRPYFLNEAEFGYWYYQILQLIPKSIAPGTLFLIFTVMPIAYGAWALAWNIHRRGRRGWLAASALALLISGTWFLSYFKQSSKVLENADEKRMNVLIIGSDSLRGDRLGYAGYRPTRENAKVPLGVSPHMDALAARSIVFTNCYTAIASTMESGTQMMASMVPHSHGLRQMYPNQETVAKVVSNIETLPSILTKKGYDTAAIGDWCAGYYEVIPQGLKRTSVSSFDNFKIYMSQAVVMSHFVVPLYFDHALGYQIFPQLQSFAQFVTPEIVTQRVERGLDQQAASRQPFFWHVFYSCNHLPYRSPEPYVSLFKDPAYVGKNKHGVDFDINSFIGSTDLESKWKALPPHEIEQIRALYDGCTRQFDDCVARILEKLKTTGLDQNTIVVINADHGDDLYEPGVTLGHGLTLNSGLQANHIPWVMHVPGVPAQSFDETVRMIDLIPTLAGLLDVPPSPKWQGRDLTPWLTNAEEPKDLPFYAETGFPFIQFRVPGVERPALPAMDEMTFIDRSFNYQFVLKPQYIQPVIDAKQRCLKTRDWKIVCTPTAERSRAFGLFHLKSDPHAQIDLSKSRPEVLAPMQRALEKWIDEHIETSVESIFPLGEPE